MEVIGRQVKQQIFEPVVIELHIKDLRELNLLGALFNVSAVVDSAPEFNKMGHDIRTAVKELGGCVSELQSTLHENIGKYCLARGSTFKR